MRSLPSSHTAETLVVIILTHEKTADVFPFSLPLGSTHFKHTVRLTGQQQSKPNTLKLFEK
jgi:hypothetical protein